MESAERVERAPEVSLFVGGCVQLSGFDVRDDCGDAVRGSADAVEVHLSIVSGTAQPPRCEGCISGAELGHPMRDSVKHGELGSTLPAN